MSKPVWEDEDGTKWCSICGSEVKIHSVKEGSHSYYPIPEGRDKILANFYKEVCERVEHKMMITRKLEGSHYAAMKEILREYGILQGGTLHEKR